MSTPARSAENLSLGLGIVLLLATAFALIDGRLPPADCPEEDTQEICTSSSDFGWFVVGGAALFLSIGLMMRMSRTSGSGSLFPNLYPDEDENAIADKVADEFDDAHDTDRLAGAWANLESKMLESSHSEEE
ncbi:MAG: hypothetical protein VX320_05650 [Candidatus Thermoplasmatota archaeon]|nr:hypothetical protein [Candidatus Thermoplasmatota archaeon]